MKKTHQLDNTEIGYVVQSQDYVIYIEGLPSVRPNDVISGPDGKLALVTTIKKDYVISVMLTAGGAKPGEEFIKQEKGLEMYEANSLLGRIISPLGEVLDSGKTLQGQKRKVDLEPEAFGINRRSSVNEQLTTGFALVDVLLPIARGQRQLLFGQPTSGKTPFVLDLMINQNRLKRASDPLPANQIVCIYVAIGKPEIDLKRYVEQIVQHESMPYTIIIASFSGQPAALISVTPSIALSIAEELRDKGISTVVIFDDLGTHAKYIREIALLSERAPGREAYPGDIFYQQAYLTERAGNFVVEGITHPVSITLLPIIETNLENFTSLIPSNIMATTDGHFIFSSNLRSEGHYPAIEYEPSVTRVGRQTQIPLFQELSDRLRILITEYQELKTYSKFGTEFANATLHQGELLLELLRQKQFQRISLYGQAVYLSLIFTNYVMAKDTWFIRKNKKNIINAIETHPQFVSVLAAIPKIKLKELIDGLNQEVYRALFQQICGY